MQLHIATFSLIASAHQGVFANRSGIFSRGMNLKDTEEPFNDNDEPPSESPSDIPTSIPSAFPSEAPSESPSSAPSATPQPVTFNAFLSNVVLANGAFGGLEVGDSICQENARTRGLSGMYRAWLSDRNEDARDRIRPPSNLFVTYQDVTIETSVHVIANGFEDLLDGQLLNGLGSRFGDRTVWTGTDARGRRDTFFDCGDWTDPEKLGAVGQSRATNKDWTEDNVVRCNFTGHRLYCLQTAEETPRPPPPPEIGPEEPKNIFVTLKEIRADAGLAGFDALCAQEARDAGLTGVYKAWAATSTESIRDRMSQHNGPYVLVGGGQVARSFEDFLDLRIERDIKRIATGQVIQSNRVWTGIQFDGQSFPASRTCEDWTNREGAAGSARGMVGFTNRNDFGWTQTGFSLCNGENHLFCLEQ